MALHSRVCSQPNNKLGYKLLSVHFKLWTTTEVQLRPKAKTLKSRGIRIHRGNEIQPTNSQICTENGCLQYEMLP